MLSLFLQNELKAADFKLETNKEPLFGMHDPKHNHVGRYYWLHFAKYKGIEFQLWSSSAFKHCFCSFQVDQCENHLDRFA